MRVIAGKAKGRKLEVNSMAGVRPLMDRIKESLFGQIEHYLEGKKVLDLFAGTGSFGIEALSRGAGLAWFVEYSPELVSTLNTNIAALGFGAQARVICRPAEEFVRTTTEQFDCIFIDPPFKDFCRLSEPLVAAIVERGVLSAQGWLIMRSFHKDVCNTALVRTVREKRYGENKVVFYQLPSAR